MSPHAGVSRWGGIVGRLQFHRSKGAVWIEMFRPWLLPMMGGAGLGKYLGLSTGGAVALAILVPLVVEAGAILLGQIERRSGATEEVYRIAAELDPYRAESLRRLRAQERLLEAILDELRWDARNKLAEPPEWPAESKRAERT